MAPTVPHILLTARGALPGGDIWTCGLRTYKRPTFLSAASGNALALAAANRWRVFRNSPPGLSLFAHNVTGATVDGVTVREIDGDGIGVTQYEGIPSTAATPVGAAPTMPNQCALVVSLISDRAGRTGKGRIYLPCIGMPTTELTNGQINPANPFGLAIVAAVKTLLDGINTDIATNFGSSLKLAVQSPTAAKAWFDDNSLADYNGAVITSFKVGTAIDTQRRRRSSLKETYQTGLVA